MGLVTAPVDHADTRNLNLRHKLNGLATEAVDSVAALTPVFVFFMDTFTAAGIEVRKAGTPGGAGARG